MKLAIRSLLVLLLALGLLLLGLGALALQDQPSVTLRGEVDHHDVARALDLLRANDPRHAVPGQTGAAQMGERDLELLLNHGAQRWLHGASQIRLSNNAALLRLSTPAPYLPLNAWLNLELHWRQAPGLPKLNAVRVGRLPLPCWLVEGLVSQLMGRVAILTKVQLAAAMVQQVSFTPQRVLVSYAWRDDSAELLMSTLMPLAEQHRLAAYAERLAALTQTLERERPQREVSLAHLLPPMFELARSRSVTPQDAVAENRAAITVLTMYANGRELSDQFPAARNWPRAVQLKVKLSGREDTPLHFLVSATLAAETTASLSRAVGLYKEVADSQGGSGFSFNDLAADRAGTRFGELAVQQAQRLQAMVASGVVESDFMPPAADLPESLPEAEFVRRYGGVGGAGYTAMVAEIDHRVQTLRVLR